MATDYTDGSKDTNAQDIDLGDYVCQSCGVTLDILYVP